jgi:hypothetical protein
MENIVFTNNSNDISVVPKFTRAMLCRGVLWNDSQIRPPILEEMMPDIKRVIESVASRYSDSTSPHLEFDELVGAGGQKLAELITKGELERQVNRSNFFKFLKASLNNSARSRVQRYRFCEKRTGQKPPPKEQRFRTGLSDDESAERYAYIKPVDISLDDPDSGIQVAQNLSEYPQEEKEVVEEYESLLFGVELLVFRQLCRPNLEACTYATVDAYDKLESNASAKLHIHIKPEHLARGIQLSLREFNNVTESIRDKIKKYRSMSSNQQDSQAHQNAIIHMLAQHFNVQVPQGVEAVIVRRLFSIAASVNYHDKVKGNQNVISMLQEIGAKVPTITDNNQQTCFGIGYKENSSECPSCDVKLSCKAIAVNIGTSDLVISPKLMRNTIQRCPVFLSDNGKTLDSKASQEETDILSYLDDTFSHTVKDGKTMFYLKTNDKKRRYVFSIEQLSPLKLRFCNPSAELRLKLEGKPKNWYPPQSSTSLQIKTLVEKHAKESFYGQQD